MAIENENGSGLAAIWNWFWTSPFFSGLLLGFLLVLGQTGFSTGFQSGGNEKELELKSKPRLTALFFSGTMTPENQENIIRQMAAAAASKETRIRVSVSRSDTST